MNSKIIGKVARFTVNLCDWMMGYHGKLLGNAIKTFILTAPLLWLFMWFFIKMS
jgi:hypothetical protein